MFKNSEVMTSRRTSDEEEIPQVQEGINISLIELIEKSQAKS